MSVTPLIKALMPMLEPPPETSMLVPVFLP